MWILRSVEAIQELKVKSRLVKGINSFFFFFKAQDLQSIVVHELLTIDYNTTINHVTLGQDFRIASYSL